MHYHNETIEKLKEVFDALTPAEEKETAEWDLNLATVKDVSLTHCQSIVHTEILELCADPWGPSRVPELQWKSLIKL